MLEFDTKAAKAVEAGYLSPDVTAQRAAVLERLTLRTGEHVLDIGAGPGLLTFDMAQLVGQDGRAVGMDVSAPMNQLARERCKDLPQASFQEADATDLPFADHSFDAVVSTQVYEYVTDITKALSEAYRIVKPGGRILILDTNWDSLVINVRNRGRHQKVLAAWEEHLAEPNLPAKLAPLLKRAGFQITSREVFPLLNTEYQANTYSNMILPMIAKFVVDRQDLTKDDAQAWHDEIKQLNSEDSFFFSLNRYLFQAIRPS